MCSRNWLVSSFLRITTAKIIETVAFQSIDSLDGYSPRIACQYQETMRSIHSHSLQDIRSQHYCHLYVVTEKGHTVSKRSQFDFRVLRFGVITYRWQAHIVKAYYYAERIESPK